MKQESSTDDGSPAPRGAGQPPARRRTAERRKHDIEQKKESRKKTSVLIQELWLLEKEARRQETPARRPGVGQRMPVLEALLDRVRGIVMVERPLSSSLSAEDVRRGLLSSCTHGAVYVSVGDWTVRESSVGMELLCPFEMVRGWVGYSFDCWVMGDDQAALKLLRRQLQASQAPHARIAVSLRLLRVCLDGGVLVMAYQRLHFQVVHVGRDEEHGGELHALLTCVLEPGAVAPLKFTLEDRLSFQMTGNEVSGRVRLHQYNIEKGQDGGMGAAGGSDSELAWRMYNMVNQAFGFTDMVTWMRSGVVSFIKDLITVQNIYGLAPDGVPWTHRSAAIEAMGLASAYRPYFVARMSGDLNWITWFSRQDPKPFLVGVLKGEGGAGNGVGEVGCVGIGFEAEARANGQRPIWMVAKQELEHRSGAEPHNEMRADVLLWAGGHKECPPDRVRHVGKVTNPPLPETMAQFCRFDSQAAQQAPSARVFV